LDKLEFNDSKIPDLEKAALTLLEKQYGKDDELYKRFFFLSQQGFWRPEKGDPRGSNMCFIGYQKEYREHLDMYSNLLNSRDQVSHLSNL
jgi:hypothetical protein